MLSTFKSILKSIFRGIRFDPEVDKIISKHPNAFGFLKKRLTRDEKFGLQLTIGTLSTFIFIFIFYGILREYLEHDPIFHADQSILNFIVAHRNLSFSHFMLFITYLGQAQIIILGVAFVSIILILLRRRYYLYSLLVSVAGGQAFVWIIKNIIERSRPPITSALVSESSFSFPSGHSFIAISFYGLLSYIVIHLIKNKTLRIIVGIISPLLIILIGFSRIYLGVHWASDVIASYASGLAWVSILITAAKIKNPETKNTIIPKKTIYKIGILFFFIWISFVYYYYAKHPLKTPPPTTKNSINIYDNLTENLFKNVPLYSTTIFGNQIEPINIVLIGSAANVQKIFNDANWLPLDSFNFKNLLVLSQRSILQKSYPKAPGFPSFWNDQPNELEFNQPTEINSAQERYHIHLWQTPFLVNGTTPVWFGTTHFDKYQKTFLPIHSVDPPLDSAREKIKNDLLKTSDLKSFSLVQVVPPAMGQNLFGSQFFTDGKAYILYIKD